MALRELLAHFGIDVTGAAKLQSVDRQLNKTKATAEGLSASIGSLKGWLAGIGAVAAARQVAIWTQETLDAADAAHDLGASLGMTAEQFQAFQTFGKVAGGADMVVGLRKLAQSADAAASGGGDIASVFKDLGVEVKNTDGSLRAMSDIAEASLVGLADMTDETRRVALATQLFGRSGNALIPSLKDGSAAMREQLATAKRLGVAFDNDFAAATGGVNDELDYFRIQMMGIRGLALRFFLPTLQRMASGITEGAVKLREWAKDSGKVKTTVAALGGTAALAVAALGISKWQSIVQVLGSVNRIGGLVTKRFLMLAAVFLLIEDALTFLRGGDSLLGDLLESFGLVKDANKDGKAFGDMLRANVVPALGEAAGAVSRFAMQGIVSFGALANAAFTSNAEMRDDYLATFMRNSETIAAFGDFVSSKFFAMTQWARNMAADMIVSFGEFAANGVLGLESILFGANSATGAFASLASMIRAVAEELANFYRGPIETIAKLATGSTDRKYREEFAALNESNRAAAVERGKRRTIREDFGASPDSPWSPSAPMAPAGFGAAVVLTDNRSVAITVGPGASPGETGRATAAAVSGALTSDRSRTLSAVQR